MSPWPNLHSSKDKKTNHHVKQLHHSALNPHSKTKYVSRIPVASYRRKYASISNPSNYTSGLISPRASTTMPSQIHNKQWVDNSMRRTDGHYDTMTRNRQSGYTSQYSSNAQPNFMHSSESQKPKFYFDSPYAHKAASHTYPNAAIHSKHVPSQPHNYGSTIRLTRNSLSPPNNSITRKQSIYPHTKTIHNQITAPTYMNRVSMTGQPVSGHRASRIQGLDPSQKQTHFIHSPNSQSYSSSPFSNQPKPTTLLTETKIIESQTPIEEPIPITTFLPAKAPTLVSEKLSKKKQMKTYANEVYSKSPYIKGNKTLSNRASKVSSPKSGAAHTKLRKEEYASTSQSSMIAVSGPSSPILMSRGTTSRSPISRTVGSPTTPTAKLPSSTHHHLDMGKKLFTESSAGSSLKRSSLSGTRSLSRPTTKSKSLSGSKKTENLGYVIGLNSSLLQPESKKEKGFIENNEIRKKSLECILKKVSESSTSIHRDSEVDSQVKLPHGRVSVPVNKKLHDGGNHGSSTHSHSEASKTENGSSNNAEPETAKRTSIGASQSLAKKSIFRKSIVPSSPETTQKNRVIHEESDEDQEKSNSASKKESFGRNDSQEQKIYSSSPSSPKLVKKKVSVQLEPKNTINVKRALDSKPNSPVQGKGVSKSPTLPRSRQTSSTPKSPTIIKSSASTKRKSGHETEKSTNSTNELDEEIVELGDLHTCQYCSRKFSQENNRHLNHEKMCAEAKQKQKKREMKLEKERKEKDRKAKLEQKLKPHAVSAHTGPKKDWRETHEQLISAIRAAKKASKP